MMRLIPGKLTMPLWNICLAVIHQINTGGDFETNRINSLCLFFTHGSV